MHIVQDKVAGTLIPVVLTKKTNPSFVGSWMLKDLSICDKLIEFADDPSVSSEEGLIRQGAGVVVDKKVKNSLDKSLSAEKDLTREYSSALQECLDLYNKEYPEANKVAVYRDSREAINVQKYPIGGAYHGWHAERGGTATGHRHLVFMTYLNDITDGGETEFMYQKLKIKPRKGLTLIWPSDWTHTHRGLPSATQVKYIVTGWYGFID